MDSLSIECYLKLLSDKIQLSFDVLNDFAHNFNLLFERFFLGSFNLKLINVTLLETINCVLLETINL